MATADTSTRTGQQVPASPNFAFLATHDAALVRIAAQAERFCFDDPNTSLIKSRQLCELLARHAAARVGLPAESGRAPVAVVRELGHLCSLREAS